MENIEQYQDKPCHDEQQPGEESQCCSTEREMPKYQSHKEVWALKIKDIIYDSVVAKDSKRETDGSAVLIFEELGYDDLKVRHDYLHKHNPKIGGYFVQYTDGYISWSPADVFEAGYNLIN